MRAYSGFDRSVNLTIVFVFLCALLSCAVMTQNNDVFFSVTACSFPI